MKIKIKGYCVLRDYKRFENYKDLIEYLHSLNIYKGEMTSVFSYPHDMLYFFASHSHEVPKSIELNFFAIKYPNILEIYNEN